MSSTDVFVAIAFYVTAITMVVGGVGMVLNRDMIRSAMLLAGRSRDVELFKDEPQGGGADFFVWDPVADEMIDPIDDVVQVARWAGPPGTLSASFADGTAGFYDVASGSRVAGATIELLDSLLTTVSRSVDRARLYVGYVDGRIQTFDSTTGQEIAPVIHAPGVFGSISARCA